MARDNFTKAVIEKLRTRVAHRCSNPKCRVPTIGPATDSDKATSIGIAAHITAASSGGPRYDATLTEKTRKSMANGIWLCSNCSIAIDKDVNHYSVELLNKWKEEAETLARQEMGKRLPGKNDAIDTLTTALTGKSNILIADSISNIHRASSTVLENLDPRFDIISAYVNGATHFEMLAKQNVPLTISVKKEYAKEYSDKFEKLVDHGDELTINGDAITIEGSKLFEELTASTSSSSLKLSPAKIKATQKIWLLNKESSVVENFDDIHGHISLGRQSFTFSGSACNEICNFNYQKSLDKNNSSAKFNLTINFEKWSGIDVRALPYFNKIYSFFEKPHDKWGFFTALEINGVEMLRSKEFAMKTSNFPEEILGKLDIIDMARTIASTLNTTIRFNSSYSFSAQEFSEFCDAVSIARRESIFYKDDLKENITCNLVIDSKLDNITQLLKINEPIDFNMVQTDGRELHLFGQLIKLPNILVQVLSATPRITTTKNLEDMADGDVITVEWIPSDKFECRIEFAEPPSKT